MKDIKTITIPPLSGKKVIKDSKIFSYIDPDFKRWGADKEGVETPEMKLDVMEMNKDTRFDEMMSTDNVLTQEQILYFLEHHKDILRQAGHATFFLFKSGEEFFVAYVLVYSGERPCVRVVRFSNDSVWRAEDRPRIVIPQLAPKLSL